MAYQPLYGQPSASTGKTYAGGYAPVKFGPAPIQKLDPNKLKDVKSLQGALHNKQISLPQFLARFQTVANAPTNLNPYSAGNIAGGAYNALVKPVTDAAQRQANNAKQNFAHLAGPTSTPQQRQAIVDNQKTAANNPAQAKVINNQKGTSASGLVGAEKGVRGGASPKQTAATLKKDAKALTTRNTQGFEDAATLAGVYAGGTGITAKTLGGALTKAGVKAAVGKDAGVNALIDAQKAAKLANKARTADIVGSQTVKEAKTTRVPVVSPNEAKVARTSLGSTAIANSDRTSIPVGGKSTQVTGTVSAVTDKQYVQKSTALSKQYEKDLSKIQEVPHPATQQVLQRQLDAKYTKLQQDLDESAGKTTVGFTGKATLPRSALDAGTPEGAPKFATEPTATATTTSTPKKVQVTATTVAKPQTALKSLPGKGEAKASGSALRTQAKAVEQGMKDEGTVSGFRGVSHKDEAAKAVSLVQDDPEKAMKIAMGGRGDNASHESAVYHAVKNRELDKAAKTGDYTVVQQLANSSRHTGVSEAAQKLGAEGYHLDPHDPVGIMNDVAKTRQKTVERRAGTTVAKEATNVEKEVKQALPKVSRQDWHSFVESLKC